MVDIIYHSFAPGLLGKSLIKFKSGGVPCMITRPIQSISDALLIWPRGNQ